MQLKKPALKIKKLLMSLMILLTSSCATQTVSKSDICTFDYFSGKALCRNSTTKTLEEIDGYFVVHPDTLMRLMNHERD